MMEADYEHIWEPKLGESYFLKFALWIEQATNKTESVNKNNDGPIHVSHSLERL